MQEGRALLVVANKWDKLKANEVCQLFSLPRSAIHLNTDRVLI